MFSKFLYPGTVLLIFLTASCRHDKAEEIVPITQELCDTLMPSYAAQVAFIIDNNCALSGCHDAQTASSNKILETYEQVKKEAQRSVFLCAIKWGNQCVNMPMDKDQLPQREIDIIECWIKNDFPQ